MGFPFLILIVEAMVHFDCEGQNNRIVEAADVVAIPSSSHDSIPSLDLDFWRRMRHVPAAKLVRLRVEPKPELEGTNSLDPELLVSSRSTIKLTDTLSAGETCTAYRGTWFGVPIVAKYFHMSEDSRLCAQEVHAYLRLGHLRGSVIPEFFGLYRTDSFALLVLEDVGDIINKPFGPEPRTHLDRDYRKNLDEWAALDNQERCVFTFDETNAFADPAAEQTD
jgi:hypothetical protein